MELALPAFPSLKLVLTWSGQTLRGTVPNPAGGKDIASLSIGVRDPATLYTFYVYPRSDTLSREYKGLGKAMLCAAVRYLIEMKKLTPETRIYLTAEPSQPTIDYGASALSDEELDVILTRYRDALKSRGDFRAIQYITVLRGPREGKVALVNAIRQTDRLIAYYGTYGFKATAHDGESAELSGTIGGILAACASGGRRRRRTAKNRRRTRQRH